MPFGILTFAIAIAYVPGLPSQATVGRWCIMALGIALLLIRTRTRNVTPAHWMGTILLVWVALVTFWAVSLWDHVAGVWQLAVLAAVFVVVAEQDSIRPMAIGVAAGINVSLVFQIAQALGAVPVMNVMADAGVAGAVGLFLSKNMAGEAAALGLILALGARAWWLAPGCLASVALIGGRGAALMLIAALAIAFVMAARVLVRERVWMVAVVLAALVAVVWLVAPGLLKISDRLQIWALVAPQITLWGDGLGSLAIGVAEIEFAHNEFLHYGFELGVGSLLIWGIAAYGIVAPLDPGVDARASAVLAAAAMAAILAQALVWFPLHGPLSAFVFAACAGHLAGLRGRARQREFDRRTDSARGLWDSEPVGIGALSAADVGRHDLSAGPQPALGARAVRPPLQ